MRTDDETINEVEIDNAMQILFSKLDEAIDDMENGRVFSMEEVFKDLESMSEIQEMFEEDKGWESEDEMLADMADFRRRRMK